MLKQIVNECLIVFDILPDGPILVNSGIATGGPQLSFVRVWRNGPEPEIYLPGSSLKGVLRSHSERIARTLKVEDCKDPFIACDPFSSEKGDPFCGACFERVKHGRRDIPERLTPYVLPDPAKNSDQLNRKVYCHSCPICRLFGSTWYVGRLATADAYVAGRQPRPQVRQSVGIDRFTGGAAGTALFDYEVITEGRFRTTLHLRNFELWQLGLVAFLLQDLRDGLLRIGAGKSRGMGRVTIKMQEVTLYYLGPRAPQPSEEGQIKLCGVGSLASTNAASYGMETPDQVCVSLPSDAKAEPSLLRSRYVFPKDSFPWQAVAEKWVSYAQAYKQPQAMRQIRAYMTGDVS